MPRFNDDEIRRYSRQILLREVGGRGQTRLGESRPRLFCPGEVGQVAAEYLWRAGVTGIGLFAENTTAAGRLTEALAETGYPGAPAAAVSSAAESFQSLAAAAPGFTLLWLPSDSDEPTLFWACCSDAWGAVGRGADALHETAADYLRAITTTDESGPGAMIVGSALALLAMQTILGIPPAPTQSVWRIDLTSAELPAWR